MCTHTDICTAGQCAGTAYVCDDDLDCGLVLTCADGTCLGTTGFGCASNDQCAEVCVNSACAPRAARVTRSASPIGVAATASRGRPWSRLAHFATRPSRASRLSVQGTTKKPSWVKRRSWSRRSELRSSTQTTTGLGLEAAQATLDYARDTLGLTTIIGDAVVENVASNKILQKIGLKFIKTYEDQGFTLNRYA